jgi:hypothetical protein
MSHAAIDVRSLIYIVDRLELARSEDERDTIAIQGEHNWTEAIHCDFQIVAWRLACLEDVAQILSTIARQAAQ